jgi:predicted ATP-dependent endonuclease of OLD family
LNKVYTSYALPVQDNVEFVRNLEDLFKQESYLKKEHSSILRRFSDIIGGEYKVVKGSIYFSPKKKPCRLLMNESSSAVRSLLDIGFYLNHCVQKHDLIMIDEPELNLHPANQRKLARLLAVLVNLGIRVYITTHSDYMVKEINTLMMLKNAKSPKIMNAYGYVDEELLKPEQIRVYIADMDYFKSDGETKRRKINTFIKAHIDSQYGIELKSFDKEILEMNEIQDEIVMES